MNIKELNEAIANLHHATQLLAITGRFLARPRKDDSHTAMEYSRTYHLLAGTPLKGDKTVRVGLDILSLELHILDSRLKSLSRFDLKGRKKEDGYLFLKNELKSFGLDTSQMKMETHFNISEHPVGQGMEFVLPTRESLKLHAELRSVAKTTLQSLIRVFKKTSEVLVWPHHFDTGLIIYVNPDEKGSMQGTVGVGFAIMDSMVGSPYFYVNHWGEHEIAYTAELPKPEYGSWIMQEWKGAILKVEDVIDKKNEINKNKIEKFFSSAIDASIGFLT